MDSFCKYITANHNSWLYKDLLFVHIYMYTVYCTYNDVCIHICIYMYWYIHGNVTSLMWLFSFQIGCDGQLGTEIYTDECGMTCGNGSTCQNTSAVITQEEPGYTWRTSNWSACSSLCGNGQESREVYCTSQDGSPVEETHCDAGKKPATTQPCLIESCDNFQWLAGDWSQVHHENALEEYLCSLENMQT